ncbi:hypothetical protein PG993_004004 [Apiospora rasikravindrae]|uniref:Rhodopsin domain-containing protein n=1 Tax=Apiospora rasikravindrae TaxID=990691 RepID=A0ABR1TBK4_9PEZI
MPVPQLPPGTIFCHAMDEDTNTVVGALMAALAIVFVGARFYMRRSKKADLKWDDWMILASLLLMIATDILAICAITANPDGPEHATVPTSTEDYTPADVLYTKLDYASTILYFSITSTTKLSILLLYNRIFSVNVLFRRLVRILMAVVVGFWIGTTVANLTNCVPMEYVWINSLSDPRYCFNYNIFWFASGICEAFLDVLIILLPIRMVLGLQLSTAKKVAIAFVFLLGGFVVLSGLLKAVFGYIPGSRQPSFYRTQLWTTVHCGTGIVCACLPVCLPLLTQLRRISGFPGSSLFRKYWYKVSNKSSMEQANTSGDSSGRQFQPIPGPASGGLSPAFNHRDHELAVRQPSRNQLLGAGSNDSESSDSPV